MFGLLDPLTTSMLRYISVKLCMLACIQSMLSILILDKPQLHTVQTANAIPGIFKQVDGGLIEVGFVHFLDILKTRPTLWAYTGNPGLYGKERTNIFFCESA